MAMHPTRAPAETSTSQPERRFRYDWSRTFDDKPEDYACTDGEMKVGRVYLLNSIANGGWFWVCYAMIGNSSGASFGQVTRDEACDLVEQAYLMRLKLASRGSDPQHHRDTKRVAVSDDGVSHLVVLQLEVSSQCLGQRMNVYGLDRVGPGLQVLPDDKREPQLIVIVHALLHRRP